MLTKSAKGILVKQLILPFIQEQFPLRFLKAGTARPERRDQLRKLELASNRVHMLFIGSRDVHWSIETLCILYATKHTSHSNHSSSISSSEIELSPLLNSASDYSDGRRYSFGRILYGILWSESGQKDRTVTIIHKHYEPRTHHTLSQINIQEGLLYSSKLFPLLYCEHHRFHNELYSYILVRRNGGPYFHFGASTLLPHAHLMKTGIPRLTIT